MVESVPVAERSYVPDPTRSVPPDDELTVQVLQETAATLGLLSATVRLHILWVLAKGEQDVGTLAAKTGQSLATVSHHLSKLKLAGLVRAQRAGKHQVYVATDAHVLAIVDVALGQRLRDEDAGAHLRQA
jgi:DNA-binding transcriptional ArsR family regulator